MLVRIAAIDILAQNMTVPVFSWLRAEGRAAVFGLLASFNVLLNLGATFLLVGVWQMGSRGALLAIGCGYSGVLLCTAPVMSRYLRRRFRVALAGELLVAGLSMMPALLSVWILQLSDRYLLGLSLSLGQTASYAVAYTLGNVLGPLIITPFSLAWHTAVYIIAKQDHARDVFRLIFLWYGLFLIFAASILSLVAHDVLLWIFPTEYTSAAAIIPLIAFSNVCYGLFEVFTVGTLLQQKLSLNLVVLPLTAFLNILLNVLFIPIWGVMGAALATLIAYGVLAGCAYYINQCIYPIPFNVGLVSIALLVGVCCYGVDLWWGSYVHIEPAWLLSLILPGFYACFLALLGWWATKKRMLWRRRNYSQA
jgi:O-antigen/teichoic acid export membrane protein